MVSGIPFDKMWRWARRLSEFSFAQVAIQLLGMASGILIARWLDVESYAQYALVVAFITAVAVVGDSGVGSQVVAIGGSYMPDTSRIPSLLALAQRYRRTISTVVSAVAGPALMILLINNGATALEAGTLAVVMVLTVYVSLAASLYQSTLTLLYKFRSVQLTGLMAAGTRFAGSLGVLALPGLGAIVPALSNVLSAWLQGHVLKRTLRRELSGNRVQLDPGDQSRLKAAVRRLLPLNLLVVAQGQGTGFILGALGATTALASVTAISRYTVFMTFIAGVLVPVLGPLLARSRGSRSAILRRYLSILSVGALGCGVIGVGLIILQTPLMALLGANYNALSSEFLIVTIGGIVGAISTIAGGLNLARGWTRGSWVMGPATALFLVGGVALLDLSSVHGAAVFMALSALPGIATAVSQGICGYRDLNKV